MSRKAKARRVWVVLDRHGREIDIDLHQAALVNAYIPSLDGERIVPKLLIDPPKRAASRRARRRGA